MELYDSKHIVALQRTEAYVLFTEYPRHVRIVDAINLWSQDPNLLFLSDLRVAGTKDTLSKILLRWFDHNTVADALEHAIALHSSEAFATEMQHWTHSKTRILPPISTGLSKILSREVRKWSSLLSPIDAPKTKFIQIEGSRSLFAQLRSLPQGKVLDVSAWPRISVIARPKTLAHSKKGYLSVKGHEVPSEAELLIVSNNMDSWLKAVTELRKSSKKESWKEAEDWMRTQFT